LIRRATAAARERLGDGGDATAALDDFIRQTRDARLSQFARRVDRLATWANIVLPPDILDSLRELVGRVRHRRTVFDTWGMGRTMTTSRGLTALFQGSPGTGKTLVAGVIARELGLELYQVDLSKVMSKWIGETERNLSQIFDAAEDGQVVLLFDEADSLFAKRTEVRSSNDRYANLEVNYLLQRLDAFEGIAILTTNAGTSIDQAFKRRMSFRLSFPFPDEETREQLWRAHLPAELPIEGVLALDMLARKYQLSGGYIRNACLRAAFLAAQQETSLHQHHLERAVALEFAELGKLSTGGTID
jgi:SpoVK/Ycf46/Vps4 family AAA+-type ATPase